MSKSVVVGGAREQMLTQGEGVEIRALARRGWTISAIARDTGRNRRTIRAYLSGQRQPGERRSSRPDAFAVVEEYCRVNVRLCPPRRGQRKGSVEKNNDYAAQRWWRTVPDDITPARAQASLDAWCAKTADLRVRYEDKQKMTVATFAAAEPLSPLPERPYPAELIGERTVSPQALVDFDGNFYSVPPGHRDQRVTVTRRLDAEVIDIISAAGNTLARHRLEPRGAHAVVRTDEHVAALEKAVLAAAGDDRAPCRRKKRIPPSPEALAEARRVRAALTGEADSAAEAAGQTD